MQGTAAPQLVLLQRIEKSILDLACAGMTASLCDTGDSSTTACAIAKDCGILSKDEQPVLGLPKEIHGLSASRLTVESSTSSSEEADDLSDRIASGSRASTSGRGGASENGTLTSFTFLHQQDSLCDLQSERDTSNAAD